MPTYSYRCRDCATAFDIQQAFTDDSLTECPTCGGSLRKLFNAVGVTFNGSGFYRTDSRASDKQAAASRASEKKPAAASSESSSSSSPSSSSSSSSNAPATKAPTSSTSSSSSSS